MATRAYNISYLEDARKSLACMLDYAINFMDEDLNLFFSEFITSGYANFFSSGDPKVLSGLSGVELYHKIKENFGIFKENKEYISIDRSEEFWLGYYLAFTQWYINRSFIDITFSISPSVMLNLYNPYHEMDERKFASFIESNVLKSNKNLTIIRKRKGFLQTELSKLSGVELRNIQAFEQSKNNISKAGFDTLNSLSNKLNCSIYDLVISYDLKQKLLDIYYSNKKYDNKYVYKFIDEFPYYLTSYNDGNYFIDLNILISYINKYIENKVSDNDLINNNIVNIIEGSFSKLNLENLIKLILNCTEYNSNII